MTARTTFTHQASRARSSRIDPFRFAMLDSFDPSVSPYFLKIGELDFFDYPIPLSGRFLLGGARKNRCCHRKMVYISKSPGK
jgi:hypothetical protein